MRTVFPMGFILLMAVAMLYFAWLGASWYAIPAAVTMIAGIQIKKRTGSKVGDVFVLFSSAVIAVMAWVGGGFVAMLVCLTMIVFVMYSVGEP